MLLTQFPHQNRRAVAFRRSNLRGFSLVEVTIAMVVLLIALLGVFTVFTYSVNYNAGNNSRTQALAVMQEETELLRSAKFTPFITDSLLLGGIKPAKTVISGDGSKFNVETTIDDEPFVDGVQIDVTKTLKEITLTIKLESPTPGWQTAIPTTTIIRRVRAN